jgi:predicted DNA-binding transcriptional regulator AlpA
MSTYTPPKTDASIAPDDLPPARFGGENERFLSFNQLSDRYGGVRQFSVWRWINKKPELGFPVPIKIGGRNFWRLSELQEFEARQAARRNAKSSAE